MLTRYTKYLINSPKIFLFIILFSISINAQTRRYEGKKKLKNKNSISNISAQKGLAIIGGYSMSTIKYNDDEINNQIDISCILYTSPSPRDSWASGISAYAI